VIHVSNSLSRRGVLRLGAVSGIAVAAGPGLASAAAPVSTAVSPIYTYYLRHGAAAGVLGVATGAEEAVHAGGVSGLRQHFRGAVYGAASTVSVPVPDHKTGTTCGRPDRSGTPVESTVVWSAATGTYAVHGGIRDRWLLLGGTGGPLGLPIGDETATTDGRGRRSRFQYGEIAWYADTGAAARIG
jgi:uncharacterized protein with LGFP repeats